MKRTSCDRCGKEGEYAAITETNGVGGDWDLCQECWWDLLKWFNPKWQRPYYCTRPEHSLTDSLPYGGHRGSDGRCELCDAPPNEMHRCAGCRKPLGERHIEGCLNGSGVVREPVIRSSHNFPIGAASKR